MQHVYFTADIWNFLPFHTQVDLFGIDWNGPLPLLDNDPNVIEVV